MKVSELLEMLQELPGDCEVRLAQQPGYPLQMHIENVVVQIATDSTTDDFDYQAAGSFDPTSLNPETDVVFITEGSTPHDTPYASRRLWDV